MTGSTFAQVENTAPVIIGAMKNVMWKGELFGNISLDTIAPKQDLYGIGPLAFLKGELLIFNGITYVAKVVSDKEMIVVEDNNVKAPFFAYTHIEQWKEVALPDSVNSITSLESFLMKAADFNNKPFMFRLEGEISTSTIHIVNLPDGSTVASPEQAHQGKTSYSIENTSVDILGFFSRNHQSIFTHHDTFLHLHLLTKDRKKMGHLDKLAFNKRKMKLYLPV